MSRLEEERRAVKRLSLGMLEKLRENSHKDVWTAYTPAYMYRYLVEEFLELQEAILLKPNDPDAIYEEACDLANICAMIADLVYAKTGRSIGHLADRIEGKS